DHRRARRLAELAATVPGVRVEAPETNIVMIDLEAASPAAVLERLGAEGVWMTQFGPRRLRAVLHRDVDDAGVERAAAALERALIQLAQDSRSSLFVRDSSNAAGPGGPQRCRAAIRSPQ